MKRVVFFLILMIVAGFSFAADPQNRSIFIDGTADTEDQRVFFLENFRMEAVALGYTVANTKRDAGYTFLFGVVPNMILYDDGSVGLAPPDEYQYIIQIFFYRNEDNAELVSFGFLFTELYEMYEYNQLVFIRAAVNIPPVAVPPAGAGTVSDIDPGTVDRIAQGVADRIVRSGAAGSGGQSSAEDWDREFGNWRDKWLYLRVSFDFPVTFYTLQPKGLHAGKGVYNDSPFRSAPLDNKVSALPGVTLGLEVQFLDWASAEPFFQVGWEFLNDRNFVNLTAGLQVKFPLKFFNNIVIEPYTAIAFPLHKSIGEKIFDSFSPAGFGGGVQLSMKGGRSSAFFLDLNYLYYFGDIGVKNSFGELYPKPDVIYYRRSVIGLGIGYKIGEFDRR